MSMCFPPETRFVILDDDERELLLARAYFKQAGLQNAVFAESLPDKLMNRILGLCQSGVAASNIVILLDIHMPGMNGFELIYELRNNIATYAVRIFMLSASNRVDHRQDASEIGADGYIVKPFTLEKLANAMAA